MRIQKFVPLALLLWLGAAPVAWAQTGVTTQKPSVGSFQIGKLDYLLGLMRERLELSRLVAEAKWNQSLPVEDLERERQFLTSMLRTANGELDAGFVEAFFGAQIQASKELQNSLFEDWRAQSVKHIESNATLEELRPRLDRVSVELVYALRDIQASLKSPHIQGRLRGYPGGALATAIKPLIQSR